MNFNTVKLEIMTQIANSTSLLSPRDTHVIGNWHISTFEKDFSNFPLVTVKMDSDLIPMYGRRTPTKPFGELYSYKFTLFVFADSMTGTRAIADLIIDWFQLHNKFSSAGIIDITNFMSKESIFTVSSRRYMRTIVEFSVLTEEALT
jgi:hypothetical protein